MKKLWDKGYDLNQQIESFTVGNDPDLDLVLIPYDCRASIAHAKMLGKIGVLDAVEVEQLVYSLERIIALHGKGAFTISREQEDGHTAIETYLTQQLGALGKKIHTARSRNDQVLTALRLYYKDQIGEIAAGIEALVVNLTEFITRYGAIALPGYTHTRKAMPSSLTMWAGAFVDSMRDNLQLLETTRSLLDQSPLGTAAGYGVPMPIDRAYVADLLGFARVQQNPIYAQLSRGKFESTILHALTQIMFDINKIAGDLILFSLPEFGYFVLPDEFCTGSSIMPQKKNPDVLELLRAKYHVVTAGEFQIKSQTANLISGYNRDVQLTKEPVMQALATTEQCLEITTLIIRNLKPDEARCRAALTDDLYATEKVYQMVEHGVPFREAYQEVARQYQRQQEVKK